MASISFQINNTQFDSTSGDACALSTGVALRYYDASHGGTLPPIGASIYMDSGLTDLDVYQSDGATPKDPSPSEYWYRVETDRVISVNSDGEVVDKIACTVETITLGPINGSVVDACANQTPTSNYYSNIVAASLVTNDYIYTDIKLNLPLAGNAKWFFLDGQNKAIQVNGFGEILDVQSCGGGSGGNAISLGTGSTSSVDACADQTPIGSYYSSDTQALIAIGSSIYTDITLLTPFVGGNQWFFLDTRNAVVEIDSSGKILDLQSCGAPGAFTLGELSGSGIDACFNTTSDGSNYYASKATADLIVGDIIYLDMALTIPYTGAANAWVFLIGQSKALLIGNSGEIVKIEACASMSAINIGAGMSSAQQACTDITTTGKFALSNASSIALGSVIYDDISGHTLFNGGNLWYLLVGEGKAIRVDTDGIVTGIQACTGNWVVYSLEIDVSSSVSSFCEGDTSVFIIYYATDSGLELTIKQIAAANLPIFYNYAGANIYATERNNSVAPTLANLLRGELFIKGPTTGDWYLTWDGPDKEWPILGTETECVVIEYTTYEITLQHASNNDVTNAADFCSSCLASSKYYFRAPENTTYGLLEIAAGNIPIYTIAAAADIQDSNFLAPIQFYAEVAGEWFSFADGGSGTRLWWGFANYGSGDIYTTLHYITKGGNCDAYVRPVQQTPEAIVSTDPFASNMFYAFYACAPIESTVAGVTTIQFPVYLVDGDHFDGGVNHMSEFRDRLININRPTFGIPDGSCVTYVNSIRAIDINEAETLLTNIGYTLVLQKLQSYLGIYSENTLSLAETCAECICADGTPTENDYTFGILDNDGFDPTLGPNFNTETNYNLDNVTRPLLRTNPKLTTNVKIVADTGDKIYLESISASKDLANIEYKRNEVAKTGSYSYDLPSFFNSKKTPHDIVYSTKRSYADTSVLDSYQAQIEDDYQYGATINYSKLYDEKFRIFAPIWADLNIPKLFVIFKINNPATNTVLGDTAADNLTRIKSMLSNAEIIKTFDLTKKSAIGQYIRNHVEDERFPASPLTFSFEENEKSSYNGIDLNNGGFTSKPEYLYNDFVQKDKPLIEANDFITDGFKRNGIVSANILNLEFLFDDDAAVDYSVSRYFGLYVDDIDSGLGEISSSSFGKISFKSVESYIDATTPSSGIPSSKLMNNTPTLGYASIADEYYKISTNKYYENKNLNIEVVDTSNNIFKNIGIKYKEKSVEIKEHGKVGYDFIKFRVVNTPGENDNIAVIGTKEEAFSFKFIKFIPGVLVTIEDGNGHSYQFNTGINIADAISNFTSGFAGAADMFARFNLTTDANTIYLTEKLSGLGDLNVQVTIANGNLIKVSKIYTNANLYNNTIFAAGVGELPKGTFSNNKFSQEGTTGDIAIAMAAAINRLPSFTSFNNGDYVYVHPNIPGYKILQHTLLVNKSNNSIFVEPENPDPTGSILKLGASVIAQWDAYYLNGGNTKNKSVLINSDTVSEIEIGDYIPTNYNNTYNKVIDVVEYIDDLSGGYHKVILKDVNSINYGEIRLFRENKLRMGLFSAYDIYDLNFDFYDTSNSNLKELTQELDSNIVYEPYKDIKGFLATSEIEGNAAYEGLQPEEILDEAYDLAPISYFSNLLPLLNRESIDGTTNGFMDSEFDRLQENNTKEFALTSRVVPNINKWVLKNTLTTREQPYYLNANEAFGRTNFSPDLSVESRDRRSFTHEWFYMDKVPTYYRYNQVSDLFSYVNFIQGFEMTKDLFKNNTKDYFDKFMIFDGIEISSDSADLASVEVGDFNMNTFIKSNRVKKYSLVENGNNLSFASTFFKGIKVSFKSRKEFDSVSPSEFVKSTEFNGYKFSTVVKVNQDANVDGKNSIEYDVIQNKAHKFVIFFITLNIADLWLDGSLSRKMLYELNHRLHWDIRSGAYVYSDTNIGGALDLLAVDFTVPGPYTINGMAHSDGSISSFDIQIPKGSDDLYGNLELDFGIGTTYIAKIKSINSNSELVIQGIPYDKDDVTNLLPVSYLTQSSILNATYKYIGGGVNAHANLLNGLSIQLVSNLLNSKDPKIKYTTIETDGTVLENRFVIGFNEGKEIIMKSNLIITEDTEKPKSYSLNKGTIGYNIVEGDEYYPFLIRHSGNYTVDMRPVVTFTDLYTHFKVNRDHTTGNRPEQDFEERLYKHSLGNINEVTTARNYYNKYNRTGTTFNLGFIQDDNTHDQNWGLIKNHFYHKVNDINPDGVIKLSDSSELLPLYPLIGEIAIDKKDLNVFRSSWDSNYYTRSLSGGKNINVPGTFDVIEERSYLASTMMKLEDAYTLLDFSFEIVNSKEKLDDILRNSNNTSDVMLFEDTDLIVADFYMDLIIYKKLRDAGVLATLNTYVNPKSSFGDKTTLVDDAESYVVKNLLDTFTLDNLLLYTKPFKGKGSSIVSSSSTLVLDANGFDADSNFAYKQHAETPLNFRLIYNKRLGYSYDIRPMIKIKS